MSEVFNMKVKLLLILSFLVGYMPTLFAEDWELTRDEIVEIAQSREANRRIDDIKIIQQAKFALVGGHIDKSILLLQRLDNKTSEVDLVIKRYLGTAYFIKGMYEKSLEIFNERKFYFTSYYPQICMMKTLDLVALGKNKEARKEYDICNPQTLTYSPNQHLWTDNVFELLGIDKTDRERKKVVTTSLKAVEILRTNNDMVRIWLKMGLFMNRENEILNDLKNVPEDSYGSQKVRELMGFIYYRTGDNEKALNFVEDISSANSENIKGNINLEKKEYELAFGHFKLALKQKENSQNAIERAIPLAWLLEQWDDGLELISKYRDLTVPERNKITLETAFQIRLKNFERAERQLKGLRQLFNNKPPREVIQMESFVATMLSRDDAQERFSTEACKKLDGLNCYLYMQTLIWEDIGKLAQRPDRTYTDNDLTLNDLKEKKSLTPLKEELLVDQRDIEELDDAELGIKVK